MTSKTRTERARIFKAAKAACAEYENGKELFADWLNTYKHEFNRADFVPAVAVWTVHEFAACYGYAGETAFNEYWTIDENGR